VRDETSDEREMGLTRISDVGDEAPAAAKETVVLAPWE
jgi:hypothetical protein